MKTHRERGFSLVTAIFLVVVIALIAAFMVTIGSVQRTTSAFAVVGARAHFAALSGIEWSAQQVLDNPGAPACFVSPTTFIVSGGTSGNFSVTLSCAQTSVTEGVVNYEVFDIDSIAEFGISGNEDYFSRTISASVASAP